MTNWTQKIFSNLAHAEAGVDTSSSVLIEMTKWGNVYTCSGVAITDKIVLTSAHCMDNMAGNVKIILDREYKINQNKFIAIDYYIKHEKYNALNSLFDYDLSILFLKDSLPKDIKPAQISKPKDKNTFFRVGFGGRDKQNIKNIIKIKPLSDLGSDKYFEFKDSKSVIGDSGGPVFMKDNGAVKLIGLHSTVESGIKTYSVNLSFFKDWIEQKITTHESINGKAI